MQFVLKMSVLVADDTAANSPKLEHVLARKPSRSLLMCSLQSSYADPTISTWQTAIT